MMRNSPARAIFAVIVTLAVATTVLFMPSPGKVTLVPGDLSAEQSLFPKVVFIPANNSTDDAKTLVVRVQDPMGWAHIKLYINHVWVQGGAAWQQLPSKQWQWEWQLPALPNTETAEFVAFHSCDVGCVEWWRKTLPMPSTNIVSTTPTTMPPRQLTKLGLVFAMPQRNWHGRAGWNVELVYALADKSDDYWMLDHVAERVMQSSSKGLRVLLRVDYDRGQSIPPRDDYDALNAYLKFLQRLTSDVRFRQVHGVIIGSGYNDNGSNSKAGDKKVTPEWYARIFSGFGVDVHTRDNVVETIRSVNTELRILVGPVRPFNQDQTGTQTWEIDVPWLNYMHTLVANLDRVALTKAQIGRPFVAPDGFAMQAPGRPDAPELQSGNSQSEPNLNLSRKDWKGAQAGFRVYKDWLAIINASQTMRGLPAYISASNTFTPDTKKPPAENYPTGWLVAALREVNTQPQIQSLCWFMDGLPSDEQWDLFSLTKRKGMLDEAANDFDILLQE